MSRTFTVVTVCTGNICRSPMAEYVLRDAFEAAGLGDVVEVASVGTSSWEDGNPIDPRAAAVLEAHGLDPSGHRAREMTREELEAADLVLALDHDHLGPVQDLLGDGGGRNEQPRAERVRMLRSFDPAQPSDTGIRDPWFGGDEDFTTVWDQITAASDGVVEHVREQLGRTEGR